MLIGLNSSLILKLHDIELHYEELTKCSKWILNIINNVNRANYLFSFFCWYKSPDTFIIRSIN